MPATDPLGASPSAAVLSPWPWQPPGTGALLIRLTRQACQAEVGGRGRAAPGLGGACLPGHWARSGAGPGRCCRAQWDQGSSRVLGAQSCLQGAPAEGWPLHCPGPGVQGAGLSRLRFPGEHRSHMDHCAGKEVPARGQCSGSEEGASERRRGDSRKLGRQSASGALGPEVGCRSRPFSRGLVQGRQDGPGGLGPGSL